MKIKCSFCLTGYDVEKNQGYCPNCGKQYDEITEDFGEKPQSFAPYGDQRERPETQRNDHVESGFQGREKPSYVNHATIDTPSMGAYLNQPKKNRLSGGAIAAIIIAVTMLLTTGIIMFVLTSAQDHDEAYDTYYENSRQEAVQKNIVSSDFSKYYIENYTQGELEGASPKEQIEALIEDFEKGRLSGRAQFDDFVLQWIYFNKDDSEVYKTLEQTAKDSGDKMLLAEVYLLHYNLFEDESYLELAQTAITPEEYFEGTDSYDALSIMLEKDYSDITWKDVGSFTQVAVVNDETVGEILGEDGEVFYSIPISNELWGYGAFGFYGATSLEVSEGEYQWGIPFYMTKLEGLTFANPNIGMGLEQLDYFEKLTKVIPTGAALADPAVLETIKITSMELDRKATQKDAKAIPDTVVNLTINDSDEIVNLDFLDDLPNLETLSITGTEITDFAPLHSKISLTELALVNTNIKNVSFLENYESLTSLTLERNDQLLSCKGIDASVGLEKLYIRGDLEDIDGLSALSGLKVLEITYPKSLSMISGLKGLTSLTIYGGGMLESIQGLSGLSNLEHLKFSGGTTGTTLYFGLEPLSGLVSLKTLHMEKISVYGSGSSIFSLKSLEELHLKEGSISLSGGSFNALPNLKILDISKATFIYNVSIWSDGPFTSIDYDTLTTVEVGGKIAGAPSLETLIMQSTKTDDLSFASDLKELKTLDVTDNYITDLTPLIGLENLEKVIATDNPLKMGSELDGTDFIVVK